MSEKHSCAVCGSRRQRNLVFFPHVYIHSRLLIKSGIQFSTRMEYGENVANEGDEYICYRCLELPGIKQIRSFDNRYARMSGDEEKPLYRYSDKDEAVLANRLKYKLG